jgi:hypothetical protein
LQAAANPSGEAGHVEGLLYLLELLLVKAFFCNHFLWSLSIDKQANSEFEASELVSRPRFSVLSQSDRVSFEPATSNCSFLKRHENTQKLAILGIAISHALASLHTLVAHDVHVLAS